MRFAPTVALVAVSLGMLGCSASAVVGDPVLNEGGPPAGYEMVPSFAEEFDAPLSPKKWVFAFYDSKRDRPTPAKRTLYGNRELQLYFDRDYLGLGIDPFMVKDGLLTIEAKPFTEQVRKVVASAIEREPPAIRSGPLRNVAYSSGMISSRRRFTQKYGYFEVRAKWSSGRGLWPAIWMLPASGAWPPEIDILEAHGDKNRTAFQSLHSKVQPAITRTVAVADNSAFHRYGVLWKPEVLDFFIDGVKTSSIPTTADMTEPMYILVNLGVGGSWPGNPDASTPFPATMQVDYVRCWQFKSPPP